jgi:hypothetical protein
MEAQARQMKTVYTVVNRGEGKSFWTKVGVGFVNRDGSWNLRLDAIPTNGTLQVRDWEPRDADGTPEAPARRGRETDDASARAVREIA